MDVIGNPSSVHGAGRVARRLLEEAREAIAARFGGAPENLVLCSGGTEADALAIHGLAQGRRLIVGATEHDAVRAAARGAAVLPVGGDGLADLGALARLLAEGPALVCLMLANNETGVIQPMAEAAELVREAGGWLHVDAVQAAGKIAIDFNALGADTMALSAHKIGGPQGVGALVAGSRATLSRWLHGGGQERGRRAGTENVSGIAGFGAAAITALDGLVDQAAWRDQLARTVTKAGAVVIGGNAPRLPQTLCFAAPGFASELQVMGLDLAGVMVSAGAACSSGKVKPSRVVEAMGRADLAPYAIRVSGGWGSAAADWVRCGEAWTEIFARHQARRAVAVA